MIKKILVYTLFFFTIIKVNAQNTGENTLGTWYEITSSNRISNKFSISGSLTNWNYQFLENQHLVLAIIGVNYHLNNTVSIGIGYGNGSIDTNFEETSTPYLIENRILEQISVKHKINKFVLSNRFRLEQRFFKYETINTFKSRIHYRFKSTFSINKTLSIAFYNEIHYYLSKGLDFQQNIVYAGLSTNINKNINLQFGYIRHSNKTKSFNRLSLQLNLKFDFRKTKK